MLLPGQLLGTSLAVVLQTLETAGASGALELLEPQGIVHRIYVKEGRITAVDVGALVPGREGRGSIGDEEGLRRVVLQNLQVLERICEAQVRFRVALPAPRHALRTGALRWSDLRLGRVRHREPSRTKTSTVSPSPRRGPLAVLGLSEDADPRTIKAAYRRLVLRVHPDAHPHASPREREHLAARLSEVMSAYRALVA
jgi:DnaJ-domain-containing protein 1